MRINKHDTQGTKPLLSKGELGYDDYAAGGDVGRVYVGTGMENIPVAKKAEVEAVDGKTDAHIARVDNPHSVTKAQVGLGDVDNTSDINKPISTATQTALDSKVSKTGVEALHSTDALRISGKTLSLYKGDGTFESVVTQDTVYTLPTATSTVKGGIEIFSDTVQTVASNTVSTTAGRTYGIQLNSAGQAVVNVPWSDNNTVYTHPNSGVTAGTYPKVTVNAQGHITAGASLSESDIPSLDAGKITSGTIDPARLPSFVDDVLEFANLAGFPTTGEAGKIYIALDTNKTYRWSGSTYIYITSGAVDSVAGKTGVVTLVKDDVGLSLVDNTADTSKNVLSATKWTTARTITLSGDIAGSASVDGSANVTITTTVQPNSVALGTDTTGNYVAGATAGTGISISGTAGEGWSPTITNTAPNVTTNITTTHNAADVVVNSSDGTDGTINGATQTLAGVMTAADKVKLDGVAAGATANVGTVTSIATSGAITGGTITSTGTISHSTADGYLHVPATGTTNNGKVLTAGATAGSLSWTTIPSAPVTSVAGKTGAITLVKGDVGLGSVDNTADSAKNVLSATKLTTARTIALSGGATGTATSFDGTGNISIPVTGLNASNLSSGTVPDDRLSGVYSGMSLKLNGNNTVFTTESSGSANISRTVYGLAEYKNNESSTTGAIVFIAPSSPNAVMHQLEVSGLLYNKNIVSLIAQGYRTTGAWSDLRKISTGTADIQVRWGVTPDGKNCLILGDVGTAWPYPHIAITRAMFSYTGVSDDYCTGWTAALVTDLTGYTNISANIIDSTMTGNVSSATKLATARTINGVNFDGTANIVAPTNLTVGTITATAVPIESSSGTNASIPAATTALAGVMSSADKVKLDGIAAGAQVNVATNLGITAGTTAGPIVTSSTGTNATLPTASASASGVVTTGNQTWAGVKTFSSNPISSAAQSTAVNALTRKDYVDNALALKVDDTEIASVNLLRADKYLAAQNVVKMTYNVDGKLEKVQYNNPTNVDYEVLTYNVDGKLTNVAHYVGSVLKGNTVLSYVNGKLVSAPFTAV